MSDENNQQPVTQEAPPPEVEAEQPAPAEAEPAAEAAPAEEQTATEQPETPAEKHQRKGGWQRTIEKQRQTIEALAEEVAALRAGRQPQQPQPAAPKEKTPDEVAQEYVNSLVEKRLQAERAAEAQRRTQAEFNAKAAAVRTEHPDFDEVVATCEAPMSPAVAEALLTSAEGPRIMYQLAANPAELARISALPPVAAAREIGRLEAKLASGSAAPAKTPAVAPRRPAVPAPITPVTTRGPSAVKDPSKMSFEEYAAWRRATGR